MLFKIARMLLLVRLINADFVNVLLDLVRCVFFESIMLDRTSHSDLELVNESGRSAIYSLCVLGLHVSFSDVLDVFEPDSAQRRPSIDSHFLSSVVLKAVRSN